MCPRAIQVTQCTQKLCVKRPLPSPLMQPSRTVFDVFTRRTTYRLIHPETPASAVESFFNPTTDHVNRHVLIEDDDADPRTEDEYREPSLGSDDDDDDDDVVSTSLTRSPSIARRCASPCLQPRPPATFGARAIATLNDDRLVSCEFIHSRPGTMTLSTGRYRCSYSLPLPLTFPPALVSLPLV